MKNSKGVELWNKAKRIIPGGTQLLSKRAERFLPEQWPSYFQKAKGIDVWDLDNRKFKDFSLMGVGSCILGYADEDVDKAVKNVVEKGTMSTLNSPEEVELAEVLLELHPWAEMARYARTGGEAMAIAVRIARAFTGKDKLAFCGYHGWHDWYLAANLADDSNLDGHLMPGLEPKGVPRGLQGTALPFTYNKIEELEKIVQEQEIGAIVMEVQREHSPEPGFLEKVREIANRHSAVLVFDEITSGWRMVAGGMHLLYNVEPDIAVFAKAMSNGYPMAAIIGRRAVMQAAQKSFISSTYWTERVGPTAAIAAIKKLKENNVPAHLSKVGKLIKRGWQELAEKHGLKIKTYNIDPLASFKFDYDKDEQVLQTLFTQEMLKRGYLAGKTVYVSFSHQERDVQDYLSKADEVFAIIKQALAQNNIKDLLEGPVAQKGFRRLT